MKEKAHCTKLGIIPTNVTSYPQGGVISGSCSYFMDTTEARLHTAFKPIQVLDKTGENAPIHRKALPLSTTTNLN
jgi:hypothetical protein